jgi:hypothetical protein
MILKKDELTLTAARASTDAHTAVKRIAMRYLHLEADIINFSYSVLVPFRPGVASLLN